MSGDDLQKMEEMLKRHLGVLSEDFQHKLGIVAEGQEMLAERMDRFEQRMDSLENLVMHVDIKVDAVEARLTKRIDGVENSLGKKIDAVAADLSAHRADTESHRGYKVCEGP